VAKKTQTSREPTPDEVEHADAGEPQHPVDLAADVDGSDDGDETHGHVGHGDEEEALGPVDVARWGAFLVGIGAGLLVAVCLFLTIAVIGA
jgi:hypothetical protein